MIHTKTTALMLGNLARQNVPKQLMPFGQSSKNVVHLHQRTSTTANAPTNAVRPFSSSNSNNNNAANNLSNTAADHNSSTANNSHHLGSSSLHSSLNNQFPTPLAKMLASNLRLQKDVLSQQSSTPPFTAASSSTSTANPTSTTPSQMSSAELSARQADLFESALSALSGPDARVVFLVLQEMKEAGVRPDAQLSDKIVHEFLSMGLPKDAERALVMLVDCFPPKSFSGPERMTYNTLAKEIALEGDSIAQALSMSKFLSSRGIHASIGLASNIINTYRRMKSRTGLQELRTMLSKEDVGLLLILQASLTRSAYRYRGVIEMFFDGKEMGLLPSKDVCMQVAQSFHNSQDHIALQAWDVAVKSIFPDYESGFVLSPPSVPNAYGNHNNHSPHNSYNTSSSSSNYNNNRSQYGNNGNRNQGGNNNSNGGNNRPKPTWNKPSEGVPPNETPSEAIVRSCSMGLNVIAVDMINKMLSNNELPSTEAIVATIEVCAKRDKATDFNKLFQVAQRSLDTIMDPIHLRAAQYEVLNSMLTANATIGDLDSAKQNYDRIVQLGQFPDASSYASLLIATTTGAVDEAKDALKILEEVRRHGVRLNLYFYNVVIGKLARGRKIDQVLELYEEMKAKNVMPNGITYGTLVSACTRVGSEEMATRMFDEMVNSNRYKPRQGPHNAMIQFYVRQQKDRKKALHYYTNMLDQGVAPTEHTFTLLIEAYSQVQPYDMKEATNILQSMSRANSKVRPTEAHYSALIQAYGVIHRDVDTARQMFDGMKKAGIQPKSVATQSLMESYIEVGQVEKAALVRDELLQAGLPTTTYIENTLMRGYGMVKDVASAEQVFERMVDIPEIGEPAKFGSAIREPSTFATMTTEVYLANGMIPQAKAMVARMRQQQFPEMVIRPVEEAIEKVVMASPTLMSPPTSPMASALM